MGKDKVEISHLQFADATFFFWEADELVFDNLLKVLRIFCEVSGLKVNLGKSVLLGMGVEDVVVSRLAFKLGCEVGEWPLKYLSLPLGGKPTTASFWNQ